MDTKLINENYGKYLHLFVMERKTLRSIYSIIMPVLNDRIRNSSVKNCARQLIFVSKWPTECPLEHAIYKTQFYFSYVRSFSLRLDTYDVNTR